MCAVIATRIAGNIGSHLWVFWVFLFFTLSLSLRPQSPHPDTGRVRVKEKGIIFLLYLLVSSMLVSTMLIVAVFNCLECNIISHLHNWKK